ncbi:MAG: hypothetical protein ACYDBQ_10195 [Thermoplasmatota archaeon]
MSYQVCPPGERCPEMVILRVSSATGALAWVETYDGPAVTAGNGGVQFRGLAFDAVKSTLVAAGAQWYGNSLTPQHPVVIGFQPTTGAVAWLADLNAGIGSSGEMARVVVDSTTGQAWATGSTDAGTPQGSPGQLGAGVDGASGAIVGHATFQTPLGAPAPASVGEAAGLLVTAGLLYAPSGSGARSYATSYDVPLPADASTV